MTPEQQRPETEFGKIRVGVKSETIVVNNSDDKFINPQKATAGLFGGNGRLGFEAAAMARARSEEIVKEIPQGETTNEIIFDLIGKTLITANTSVKDKNNGDPTLKSSSADI